jgi:hypothetical protein
LAIASAIRPVIESADSAVAFLSSPEGVPPDRFKALSGFAETGSGTNALFQLARLVNQRVVPPVADDDTSIPLWSLVQDILCASGKPASLDGSEDDATYNDARKLLYSDDEDGLPRPTTAYLTYMQLRDQWFCLQQGIGAKKLELGVKAADDPGNDVLQDVIAKLQRDLSDLELRWEAEGQRNKIEQALEIVSEVNARSPLRQWNKWKDELGLFVDPTTGQGSQTDILTQGHFAATAISPAGIDESPSSWTKMALTGADVDNLAAKLPAELTARFNPAGTPLEIESISFEWTTAGIVRPWLDRALFASPAWTFKDPARIISDGADPPGGEWPYIATGILLVRSVKVAFRPPPPQPTPQPPKHILQDILVHKHMVFDHVMVAGAQTPKPTPVADATVIAAEKSKLLPQFARGRFYAATATAAGPEILAVKAQQPAFIRLQRRTFFREPPKLADAASTPAGDEGATVDADPIMIFGLICSRMPRSPNPDPTLFPLAHVGSTV